MCSRFDPVIVISLTTSFSDIQVLIVYQLVYSLYGCFLIAEITEMATDDVIQKVKMVSQSYKEYSI